MDVQVIVSAGLSGAAAVSLKLSLHGPHLVRITNVAGSSSE